MLLQNSPIVIDQSNKISLGDIEAQNHTQRCMIETLDSPLCKLLDKVKCICVYSFMQMCVYACIQRYMSAFTMLSYIMCHHH